MSNRRVLCISPLHTTLAILTEAIRAAGHEAVTTILPVAAMLDGIHAVVIDCETHGIANIVAAIRAIGTRLPVIGLGTTCTEGMDFVIADTQINLLGTVISEVVPEPE
jgi:hypothetical protein